MYIGLIDQDLLLRAFIRPSLELMKISTYHKSKGDIVEIGTNVNDIQKYSKVYFWKDRIDTAVPGKILTDPRVTYGGRALTGRKYIPLSPEIDFLVPDFSIYESALSGKLSKQNKKESIVKKFRDSNMIRITNKGEIYTENYLNLIDPNKNKIFFYDDDFFECPSWPMILDSLNGHKFHFFNPHYVTTEDELDFIIDFANNRKLVFGRGGVQGTYFYFPMPGDYDSFRKILYKISNKSFITLELTHNPSSNNMDSMKEILNKMSMVYAAISVGVSVYLKCKQKKSPFYGVMSDFCKYTYSAKEISFFASASKKSKKLLKEYYGLHPQGRRILFTPTKTIQKEVWKP